MSKVLTAQWMALNEKLLALQHLADEHDNNPIQLSKIQREITEVTRQLAHVELLLEKKKK